MAFLAKRDVPHPSWQGGFARYAAESAYPGLWKDKTGHWVMSLGPTGSMLKDVSGVGLDGTFSAGLDPGTDWVIDEPGYTLDFVRAAGDEFVDLGSKVYLNTSGPFTFAWKMRPDIFDSSDNAVGIINNSAGGGISMILIDNASYPDLVCGSGDIFSATGGLGFNFTGTIAGNWHSCAMVFNGGTLDSAANWTAYQDGQERSITTGAGLFTMSAETHIGKWQRSGGAAYFDGLVDDFRTYNRALTADEVRLIHEVHLADLIPRRTLGLSEQVAAGGGIRNPLGGPMVLRNPLGAF